MTLTLRNNILTRFGTRDGYAFSEEVTQAPKLSALLTTLLEWLGQNLATGEKLTGVVLESVGTIPTGWTEPNENGTQEPLGFRPVINAAVSVTAPAGMRTFVVSSEALPEILRDQLLGAWHSLS